MYLVHQRSNLHYMAREVYTLDGEQSSFKCLEKVQRGGYCEIFRKLAVKI